MRLEELLGDTARTAPDALALSENSGRRCTYRALEEMAEAVACALREAGVGPGDRVGFCGAKRIETVAALFGVLKAGAAYVPIDAEAPVDRGAAILTNCRVRAVLVDPDGMKAFPDALEGQGHAARAAGPAPGGFQLIVSTLQPEAGDLDLAYVLYTSGSTGKPKGVCHTHASALAFVDWCSSEFQPTPQDCFSSHAPLHFDLSILDVFLPVKHGAAIRLIDADEGRSPKAIAELIAAERLTIWYSTPTILRALVEYGDLARFDHSSLRLICFAGEVFPARHLRALARFWPKPIFYNLYGPTETNVCTFHHAGAAQIEAAGDEVMPIGRACSGDELMVISADGSPAQHPCEGELVVSGGSVMRGYWGAPDADSRAFLTHEGRRWYRTGDIVAERSDGALAFRGRVDRMVKRRGYRIELGEIESALLRHERISQAAAVAIVDQSDETRIVAFCVPTPGNSLSFVEMKRHCSKVLPGYMSPDVFPLLADMPSTSTGKIDYGSLRVMAHDLLANRVPGPAARPDNSVRKG